MQKSGFSLCSCAGRSPHGARRNVFAGLVLLHLASARGAARPARGAAC
ncbi:hypothetical protein A2U01_0085347, partial [Trifolium medium]|nr:hypothetical protein [Trifolium medium]